MGSITVSKLAQNGTASLKTSTPEWQILGKAVQSSTMRLDLDLLPTEIIGEIFIPLLSELPHLPTDYRRSLGNSPDPQMS
jgi:hypothetical protein